MSNNEWHRERNSNNKRKRKSKLESNITSMMAEQAAAVWKKHQIILRKG
jgi:hypothetical protein